MNKNQQAKEHLCKERFPCGLEIPYQVNTQIKNLQSQQIDTTEQR